MSETTADGSLGRILAAVTVRTHQQVRANDRERAANLPCEVEQQFQVKISGTAGEIPGGWAEVELNFEYAFFQAAHARRSTLSFPHVSFGSHMDEGSNVVAVHAVVREWIEDETNGSIIGAIVSVCATGNAVFSGVLHITFQGWGMLIEAGPENTEEEELGQE